MITVKDIRDKKFSIQKHGYHEDEVDDFLDEIADQLERMIRENRSMVQELDDTKAALARAEEMASRQAAPAEAPEAAAPAKASGAIDDAGYFKNLEDTVRESLLVAQRIANQTVQEAKEKAEKAVSEAEQHATTLREDAKREADALMGNIGIETEKAKTQLEAIQASINEHKAKFLGMLEQQMNALKGDNKE